jgi:hypothetical protein
MIARNINMNISQHTEVFPLLTTPNGTPCSAYPGYNSHSKFSFTDLHKLLKSMPAPVINFVGRDVQLQELQLYFHPRDSETSNRQQHSCAVHGMGGIGKTQFTLKFIESNQEAYVHLQVSVSPLMSTFLIRFTHVFWIDATKSETIEASFIAISTCSFTQKVGTQPSLSAVRQLISSLNEDWLLVFDGADHEAHFLKQYIPSGNCGNIIISSRNPHVKKIVHKVLEISDMDIRKFRIAQQC